jgi:hypothetical protein
VLALDGGEDKIGGGLDRAWLVSFAGLHFELEASALTNARLARVAQTLAPKLTRSGSCPSSGASAGVSPTPHASGAAAAAHDPSQPGLAQSCVMPRCRVLEFRVPAAAKEPVTVPSESLPGGVALRWRWHGPGDGPAESGEGEVLTRFGRARVAQRSGGMLAHVWLGEDPRAAHLVLSGLAALLLHRAGGALLHSASVVLDDRVIAFIGPSGAGKSTACRHVAEAELFSVDRLAVLPVPPRSHAAGASSGPGATSARAPSMWLAHPLSGGTRSAADMPSAPEQWRPLAGVLRAQRGALPPPAEGALIRAISGAGAVAALRESAFQIGSGPGAEGDLLATLEALTRGVPVARLELSLGACLAPTLRRWLVDQAKERT